MTIMLHPNKQNPERLRVWDKEMKVQAYYALTKEGRQQAEEHQAKLDAAKHAKALRENLPSLKLFHEDGRVKGLKRVYRERKGRTSYECLSLQATVGPKQQKSTEILLSCRSFDEAYSLAIQWLLDAHKITSTYEIRMKFKQARRYYWSSVIPDVITGKSKA
jgi:hypothetical protein